MLGITFIRNPIHGDVESPELLGRLHFNVPNRFTRNCISLVLNHCISNYAMHEPFRVLCNDYNRLYHLISTTDSLPIFKSIILSYLVTNYCSFTWCILSIRILIVTLSFCLSAILFTRQKRWRAPHVTSIAWCRRATCLYWP